MARPATGSNNPGKADLPGLGHVRVQNYSVPRLLTFVLLRSTKRGYS